MPRTKSTTTATKAKATVKRNARKAVNTAKKEVNAVSNIKIKESIKDINNFAVETANIIVDETFETTAEWQNILDKAVKSGFKVASKNQELVFSALESMKGSIKNGTKKFSTFFSKN
jgi:hypothetical protein